MREPEEIIRDKEANLNEIKKWLPHIKRESAEKEYRKLAKKDVELEKELNESMEQKFGIKLHLHEQKKDHDVTKSLGKETQQQKSHNTTPNATK